MQKPRVQIYTDYKSSYAFVANQRLFELEEKARRRTGMAALYVARRRIHGNR